MSKEYMAKRMKLNWKPWLWTLHKQEQLIAKLAASIIFLGLVCRPFFSQSSGFSDVVKAPFLEKNVDAQSALSVPDNFQQISDQVSQKTQREKCDLFTGEWIPNPAGPLYTNESCHFIEKQRNCMRNGRPDTGYLYWRWNPRECELPPFNAQRFLELMRNKVWAFIGDSIARNHIHSLLCLLSKVEEAVEIYHDDEVNKSGKWKFLRHNFTISVIWSPFLSKAAVDSKGILSPQVEVEVDVDKLDTKWTDLYHGLDYLMFSNGKWFIRPAIYYENDKILGCHKCQRNLTELGHGFPYRKVLRNLFNFIIASNHKGMIFYSTTTPDHLEDGGWFHGGHCKRTAPDKEGEFRLDSWIKILRDVELEEFEKAAARASEKGLKLKLLDVTQLSLLRPDGHPGPYRFSDPFEKSREEKPINDCQHWCLPGPIDSWNDVLMEMVVNG